MGSDLGMYLLVASARTLSVASSVPPVRRSAAAGPRPLTAAVVVGPDQEGHCDHPLSERSPSNQDP
jgi:hypothetical protein